MQTVLKSKRDWNGWRKVETGRQQEDATFHNFITIIKGILIDKVNGDAFIFLSHGFKVAMKASVVSKRQVFLHDYFIFQNYCA